MDEKFLPVSGILVGQEIAEIHFKCDLLKCKGACCTFESHYGAPLTHEEVISIEHILHKVKRYLPANHRKEIEENGFFEVKRNEVMTRSFSNRACVFVFYDNGIAKCAIEKAFIAGETDFRKPLSCHLFPIRRSDFGGDILKYEKLDECSPALENGILNNTTIAEFCKEPLSRLYGDEWYLHLMETIGR